MLEVDTNYVAVNQNNNQTYPYMQLVILGGRNTYRTWFSAPYREGANATARVEFFGKPGIFLVGADTADYSISIQITLEEETENA